MGTKPTPKYEFATPTLSPKDWGANDPVGFTAWEMAMVFKNNRDDDGEITQEGHFWLSQVFGRLDPEDRASGFIQFLGHLDAMEVEYSKEEFNRDEFIVPGVPH